jgi:hypothetical protein
VRQTQSLLAAIYNASPKKWTKWFEPRDFKPKPPPAPLTDEQRRARFEAYWARCPEEKRN